jgi:beta-lactamase superfamily II metal-dependent hydrolase
MSDSGFNTEKWILEHRPDLRAEVIVMGRHGTDPCGLPEFFRSVQPRAVVATSAAFPEVEVLPERMRKDLARARVVLFDQGQCGAVTMRREGEELVLRGFLDGPMLKVR